MSLGYKALELLGLAIALGFLQRRNYPHMPKQVVLVADVWTPALAFPSRYLECLFTLSHPPSNLQVNEHYVKPLTLAAGGMSYALMNL